MKAPNSSQRQRTAIDTGKQWANLLATELGNLLDKHEQCHTYQELLVDQVYADASVAYEQYLKAKADAARVNAY